MSNNKRVRFRYLNDERNRGSVMKVLNDFLVDIMGAIIPGFLFIFSFGIALGVPIILIYDISIPKSFYNSIFSFGSIILILLLSYVIGHAFYRAEINEPDKASIAKKMKKHINDVYNECSVSVKGEGKNQDELPEKKLKTILSKIPEEITYRMKQMNLNTKYIDSSHKKSIEDYIYSFYKELTSNTTIKNNTDNVFYIIKNHFDGNESSDNTDDKGDIATRSDYFNLIDILSDCIDTVVDHSLQLLEWKLKKPNDSLVRNMKVFFKEIKYIDYCDNYHEFKYLLELITGLKDLSLSRLDANDSKDGSSQKTMSEALGLFSKALDNYKTHILMGSGVKEAYIKDYESEIKEIKKHNKTIDNSKAESDKSIWDLQEKLLLYTSIRRTQNEEGTPHEDSGGFPYINYENYLFKRNLHHLAEMVNWNYREGRTKNQINRYKIKIQLFCPDAYGVLNKNESHVRMASSSWFVSKFLLTTNWIITGVFLAIILLTNHDGLCNLQLGSAVLMILPITCPICVNLLLIQFRSKIEDFIHYQRLREIYFALYTYHECKNEIKYKEKYYSHCPFPDEVIMESELQ